MTDFTASWDWPQWAIVVFIFVRFAYVSACHGNERLETSGERKGKPERYNAFAALSSSVLWLSVLICGGFFA